MEFTIRDYQRYLWALYGETCIDSSLFMKLVEEIGEVAEVLNRRDGRKAAGEEAWKPHLANELADVIHYAAAIAALNQIDLHDTILEKDRKAAQKYHHQQNLEEFLTCKPQI